MTSIPTPSERFITFVAELLLEINEQGNLDRPEETRWKRDHVDPGTFRKYENRAASLVRELVLFAEIERQEQEALRQELRLLSEATANDY